MLQHVMVEIFSGCNLKCNMCSIWKESGKHVEINALDKFLASAYCSGLESIGITGGEPMLSNQLTELAEVINRYENIKTIYITSNGSLPDRLIDFVNMLHNKITCINISIDGLKDVHDHIRGVPVFDKAMGTLNLLKQNKNVQSIGMKMTVQLANMDQIMDVYKLSKQMKVSFGLMPVVATDAYFENMGTLEDIRIEPGTSKGNEFRAILQQLQKKMQTPYLDMLIELYSGITREMTKYQCLFPAQNNMIYADGTLGLCFMTGRRDVSNYLSDFAVWEQSNLNYREDIAADFLCRECKTCPASCAGNYQISLPQKIMNDLKRWFFK